MRLEGILDTYCLAQTRKNIIRHKEMDVELQEARESP